VRWSGDRKSSESREQIGEIVVVVIVVVVVVVVVIVVDVVIVVVVIVVVGRCWNHSDMDLIVFIVTLV